MCIKVGKWNKSTEGESTLQHKRKVSYEHRPSEVGFPANGPLVIKKDILKLFPLTLHVGTEEDRVSGPSFLPPSLPGPVYHDYLRTVVPELLQDVDLQTRIQLCFTLQATYPTQCKQLASRISNITTGQITICSENKVWPPEDGRKDARNMLRNNWLTIKSVNVASSWSHIYLLIYNPLQHYWFTPHPQNLKVVTKMAFSRIRQ